MKLKHLSVLGWTALFLLALEVGLEARAHRRGWESILFGPGTVQSGDISQMAQDTTLELGPTPAFPFRSPVVTPWKTDSGIRIWFGSASYGEDTRVPAPDIFPNLAGSLLHHRIGRSVEVLNASRAGLTIANNARDLEALGPTWTPDYAVLYGLSMDLGLLSEQFLGAGVVDDPDRGKASDPKETELVSGPFRYLSKLYETTTLYSQLKSHVTTLITEQQILADSLPAVALDSFRATVNAFVDAAIGIGATPVLTTFATSYSLDDPEPLSLASKRFILRYNPYLKPQGWLAAVKSLNSVFWEVAGERDITLIDLDSELTSHHDLFRDPVHFSVLGHSEAATLLADGIAQIHQSANLGGIQ
ncbi:hypothetical protein ACFL3B_02650 [Gemmatimonadota bacterium]